MEADKIFQKGDVAHVVISYSKDKILSIMMSDHYRLDKEALLAGIFVLLLIGFAGKTEAVPILLDGLERLEYRGYDSAGVAVVSADGRLQVKKSKGRLSVLRELLDSQNPLSGNIGIGHTRWATHGEPNDTNAHPHVGRKERLRLSIMAS